MRMMSLASDRYTKEEIDRIFNNYIDDIKRYAEIGYYKYPACLEFESMIYDIDVRVLKQNYEYSAGYDDIRGMYGNSALAGMSILNSSASRFTRGDILLIVMCYFRNQCKSDELRSKVDLIIRSVCS